MTPPQDKVALLQRRIRVALGEEPGDVALAGGHVVNVFTGAIERANVVVADGAIAGVGPYDWPAAESLDLAGRYVLPGLIDAHMHLESTLLAPGALASVVAPHGTTAVVCDPHEIGNVLGVRGIEALIAAAQGLPVDFFFMAPSCVPASRWEEPGAALDLPQIELLLEMPRILGLAEVMDYPGVLAARPELLAKVAAAAEGRVDGHAPGLTGRSLVAYAALGIRSDHESTALPEALEKAAHGFLVQVREGSSARNLEALLPALRDGRLGDWCLCTDDVHPGDLLSRGHIDGLLARLVAGGVAPAQAVRHASLIPARHYGLRDRGAVAPGFRADLAIVADLASFAVERVMKDGRWVAQQGKLTLPIGERPIAAGNSLHLPPLTEAAFVLIPQTSTCPVIRVFGDQIVTARETATVALDAGRFAFDPAIDCALAACIERHGGSGRVGLGLVAGFRFQRHGALGTSVAHDAHNLLIAGTNARDMLVCARALAACGGGFVVVADGTVTERLELPVAGLLSRLSALQVAQRLLALHHAAVRLGCPLPAPFATLSFLALSVIGAYRITTRGVLDVERQELVRL